MMKIENKKVAMALSLLLTLAFAGKAASPRQENEFQPGPGVPGSIIVQPKSAVRSWATTLIETVPKVF